MQKAIFVINCQCMYYIRSVPGEQKEKNTLWLDSHRRNVLLPARKRQLHYLNRSYGYPVLVLANPSPISFLKRHWIL